MRHKAWIRVRVFLYRLRRQKPLQAASIVTWIVSLRSSLSVRSMMCQSLRLFSIRYLNRKGRALLLLDKLNDWATSVRPLKTFRTEHTGSTPPSGNHVNRAATRSLSLRPKELQSGNNKWWVSFRLQYDNVVFLSLPNKSCDVLYFSLGNLDIGSSFLPLKEYSTRAISLLRESILNKPGRNEYVLFVHMSGRQNHSRFSAPKCPRYQVHLLREANLLFL